MYNINWSVCYFLACPVGYTGYYCEVNINDCAQAKCHHYSNCIDLIGNYSCRCGPRWTGRHCDIFLGSLCNGSVCQNGGICRDTDDKNNYTCTCTRGYTGRNCELQFNPCDSSPCKQGGNCSKFTIDDFQCDCPAGQLKMNETVSLCYYYRSIQFSIEYLVQTVNHVCTKRDHASF